MKIIFAGTPEFAAIALAALIDAGHDIVAVYTQPDRPAGRGQKLTPSAVKSLALQHQLPVYQPLSLKSSSEEGLAAQQQLKQLAADVMVVAAYGLILPQVVLDIPRFGCLNIHASLLPAWRGAAPIHRALLAGDRQTGITIMQMDAGLDTGDMLYKTHCEIDNHDTSTSLHDKLAVQGGQAICRVLTDIATLQDYQARRDVQDHTQASYAHKLVKTEARIDWQQPAAFIHRQIRAYQPWPVAFCELEGQVIRLWSATQGSATLADPHTVTETNPSALAAGTVVAIDAHAVQVICGDGQSINLLSLQWAGGKPLSSQQLLQNQKIKVGQRLH